MTSLYGRYIRERESYNIEEDERGFATYMLDGDICYIRDIYVHPDYRHDKVGSAYADRIAVIAKKHGAKFLLGSILPSANFSTEGMKVLLAYGFRLDRIIGELIYFRKEI